MAVKEKVIILVVHNYIAHHNKSSTYISKNLAVMIQIAYVSFNTQPKNHDSKLEMTFLCWYLVFFYNVNF